MKNMTIAQLKNLLGVYDDNTRISFIFKTPVKEIGYKEFSGGDFVDLDLSEMNEVEDKTIIKIILK